MDRLVPVFGSFMQLAFLVLIVWAIARASGRGRGGDERGDEDTATSVRRLFVYGLLFVTLVMTATGAVFALQELFASDRAEDERSQLALGLALMI